MAKYKRILVTGWSGLVGSAIDCLGYIDPEIIGITHAEYDMLKWVDVNAMLGHYKPDAIIHLAAKVGGVAANMKAPATFFMENVTMNTHILEAARIHKVKRVICFLSTCVFPDNGPYPLKPDCLHQGPPHPSNYGYAYAKRMLAVQCQSYNQEYGTNFLPVIPCNIYGPHDNFHPNDSHVVPALIRRFYEAKKTGQEAVAIWGSGNARREFVYSEDVARLLLDILNEYHSNEPIILSSPSEDSIAYLVNAICRAVGYEGKITWDTTKPEGQLRKPSDNGPLRRLLPKFRFTPLEEGIKKTVEWFEKNYPNVRGV